MYLSFVFSLSASFVLRCNRGTIPDGQSPLLVDTDAHTHAHYTTHTTHTQNTHTSRRTPHNITIATFIIKIVLFTCFLSNRKVHRNGVIRLLKHNLYTQYIDISLLRHSSSESIYDFKIQMMCSSRLCLPQPCWCSGCRPRLQALKLYSSLNFVR